MRSQLFLIFLAFIVVSCAPSKSGSKFSPEANQSTALNKPAERIKFDVDFLADDARMGREAGTQGYDDAADYVASRMAAIGMRPGTKDGWFQSVSFLTAKTHLSEINFSTIDENGVERPFVRKKDFVLAPTISREEFSVTAPVVFVGYGLHAPQIGIDDYEGLDIGGKIVVFFSGAPSSLDSEKRAHFGSSAVKRQFLSENGAVGAITVFSSVSEKRFSWKRIAQFASANRMTWIGSDGQAYSRSAGLMGTASMSVDGARQLFEDAQKSFDELRAEIDSDETRRLRGFDLPVQVSMSGSAHNRRTKSANVIGLIPGNDPTLRNEYLILTAHLDHTGVDEVLQAAGKDGIKNGAMDNAMGVAVMLEAAAEIIKRGDNRRPIIVAAVTAEEKGLLGAGYLAKNPPAYAAGKLVANVNLDMPVLLHAFTDVIAYGAEYTSLGDVLKIAAAEADIKISPDPIPEQGIFTRSDHYRFVQEGVPSLYLWTGFENGGEATFGEFFSNHYHKPSDEPTLPILYEEAARFALVNTEIAYAIANADEKPYWREGNTFTELFAKQ